MYNGEKEVLISVCCTCYNHEKYLNRCIDSILKQRIDLSYEILIHDDCSTDGSRKIINEYERRYPMIVRSLMQIENQYSKGRNVVRDFLLPQTRGKYIVICDCDDYWCDEYKLKKQIDAIINSECDFCYHTTVKVRDDEKSLGKTIPCMVNKSDIVTLQQFLKEEFCDGNWAVHLSSIMAKKEIVDKYLLCKDKYIDLFPMFDLPYTLFLFSVSDAYYLPEVMTCYRITNIGYMANSQRDINTFKSNQIKVINAIKEYDCTTDYKYHEFLDRGIVQREFLIHMKEKNFKIIFDSRYSNIYKKLPIVKKVYIYLGRLQFVKKLYNYVRK